jgi:AbrB family looped-hinge helix DNA binding protein
METSVVSSKFQIVIPRKIREKMNVKPGQRVAFIEYRNSIRMVIVPSIEEAYGMFKGLNRDDIREEQDDEARL